MDRKTHPVLSALPSLGPLVDPRKFFTSVAASELPHMQATNRMTKRAFPRDICVPINVQCPLVHLAASYNTNVFSVELNAAPYTVHTKRFAVEYSADQRKDLAGKSNVSIPVRSPPSRTDCQQ